ncbi:7986_t:CDS:10, partial [Diversispora eburnea]
MTSIIKKLKNFLPENIMKARKQKKEAKERLAAEEVEEVYFGLNDQDYKELMALPTDKHKTIFLRKLINNEVTYIEREIGGEKVEEAWYPLNEEELDVFMGRKRVTWGQNEVREFREYESRREKWWRKLKEFSHEWILCLKNNEEKNFELYLKSAEKGILVAWMDVKIKMFMELMYSIWMKAFYWYKKAVECGDISEVGKCFYEGWVTERDIINAAYWLNKAKENGMTIMDRNGKFNLHEQIRDWVNTLTKSQASNSSLKSQRSNYKEGDDVEKKKFRLEQGHNPYCKNWKIEVTLLSVRVKLHCMDGPVWKERGIGILKLNYSKDNKKSPQFVIRTENMLRVNLNVSLFPGIHDERSHDKFERLIVFEDKLFHLALMNSNVADELYEAIKSELPTTQDQSSPPPR